MIDGSFVVTEKSFDSRLETRQRNVPVILGVGRTRNNRNNSKQWQTFQTVWLCYQRRMGS